MKYNRTYVGVVDGRAIFEDKDKKIYDKIKEAIRQGERFVEVGNEERAVIMVDKITFIERWK